MPNHPDGRRTIDLGELAEVLREARATEKYKTLSEFIRLLIREGLERRGYLKGGAG